jgi:hypothetical protein
VTEEVQLVLVGGAISLITALSITAVTTLLNYWLDRRREARKLRADLLHALGRNTVLVGGQQVLTNEAFSKLYEAAKARGTGRSSLDDLAFDLGFAEALAEMLQEETNPQRP